MVDLGQIFTKRKIADYMVGLLDLKQNSTILDPCFGEGVFIESLHAAQKEYKITGIELDSKLFNKFKEKDIVLVDTAGRNHNDIEQINELNNILSSSEDKEIFLLIIDVVYYSNSLEFDNVIKYLSNLISN